MRARRGRVREGGEGGGGAGCVRAGRLKRERLLRGRKGEVDVLVVARVGQGERERVRSVGGE